MLWVLWDILIPVLLAFFTGLFVGWLLWRWRRRSFDSEAILELRRDNGRQRSDIQQLQARNAQLAERSQISAATPSETKELVALKARNTQLTTELQESRDQLQQALSARSAADVRNGAVSSIRTLNDEDEVQLDDAIAVRDKMIATLQRSLELYGDQEDLTALSAEVAMRDRKISALENLLDQARH